MMKKLRSVPPIADRAVKSRTIELRTETNADAVLASSNCTSGARSLIADLGTNEAMLVLLSVALAVFRVGVLQRRAQ